MHPFAFAQSLDALDWGMWRADDPDAHEEAAERLRLAHSDAGRPPSPSSTATRRRRRAASPQTIPTSALPYDDGSYEYPYCDNQAALPHPARTGSTPSRTDSYNGPFYGVVNESLPNENIYGMVWDDVFLDPTTATNPYQPGVYDAFQASANAGHPRS